MLGTVYQSGLKLAYGRLADANIDFGGGKADPNAPGMTQLKELIKTIRTWSIVACVLAIIIAAILWAWGAQSQNAAQATQGKKGILVAVAAAAIIFAAEALVNWGTDLGGAVQSN